MSFFLSSLTPRSSEQIADFYQGQEQDPFFRPSLGAIRLLLEDSIHSLPELSLLIRFAAAVFSRHHIVCSQTFLASSFLPSNGCRVFFPFPIRCLPPLSCATICFFYTTRVSRFVGCLSRRIWLTALLLQQVVCCDGEKRDGNGEKRDGNGENSDRNGLHNYGNGEHNNTPLESSLRLCHTRKDTLAALATLSLSHVDILRVALHLCSENSGRFIDTSLIELIRYIDPVQSIVEVTREVGCVIALTTPQQRRALYWLVRVLEKSTSLIPFCARELADEEQV